MYHLPVIEFKKKKKKKQNVRRKNKRPIDSTVILFDYCKKMSEGKEIRMNGKKL